MANNPSAVYLAGGFLFLLFELIGHEYGLVLDLIYLFILSFVCWFWCFHGFFLGKLRVMADAISYYDHSKFLIDWLSSFQIPLWDPNWSCGVPNEFFLRRLGEFNPFYWIAVIFHKCGLSYDLSYFFFLAIYSFVGFLGFYFLVKTIYQDKRTAFIAFLLLCFSSFTTILFRSFIMLLFVPMVWFFAFAADFYLTKSKRSFCGVCFSLMLIFTTYLPFYFLTILLTVFILWFFLFSTPCKKYFISLFDFVTKNKIIAIMCLLAMILSLIPGIQFYLDGASNDFTLPVRHHLSTDKNALHVSEQSVVVGGIMAHTLLDMVVSHLKDFELSRIFIPIIAYVLLICGFGIKINKRFLLYFLTAFFIYLISLYDASPIYPFLYKHVFFFKTFRNFQFFVWLVHVPFIILLCTEIFHQLFIKLPETESGRNKSFLILAVSHLVALILLFFTQEAVIFSTYVSIFASFIFVCCWRYSVFVDKKILFLLLFLIVLIIQPFEAYHYLNLNTRPVVAPYLYDEIPPEFSYLRSSEWGDQYTQDAFNKKLKRYKDGAIKKIQIYYALGWLSYLRENIEYSVFLKTIRNKFVLYDCVKAIDALKPDFKLLERSLDQLQNIAYVSSDKMLKKFGDSEETSIALAVETGNAGFKVLKYRPGYLSLQTNLEKSKFLVYNDSYHEKWSAFINGEEVDIFRTNVAFKGIWLPKGDAVVEFKFGSTSEAVHKWFLTLLFWVMFISVLVMSCKKEKYSV